MAADGLSAFVDKTSFPRGGSYDGHFTVDRPKISAAFEEVKVPPSSEPG